jgi:protein-disulfide isomerase
VQDLATFDDCMFKDTGAATKVDQDNAAADALGVYGTPAVLLDSLLFSGFPGRRYIGAYVRTHSSSR